MRDDIFMAAESDADAEAFDQIIDDLHRALAQFVMGAAACSVIVAAVVMALRWVL